MRYPTNNRTSLLILLAVFLPLSSLLAQSGQLIIRVFEDATNAVLEGATVEIESLSIREATDDSGRVVLRNLPEGEYMVDVRYRGLPDASQSVQIGSEPTALPVRMGADESVYELTDFSVRDTITSDDIAQQIRRNSLNIKDVVASDTMGQMPDRTVADAVKRLPGISLERASGTPQNEYVTIRGMYSDFNKVSVDGMAITMSNFEGTSRSVPLNVISSSVADTIEVTKAVTPDMDGDAIGGSINVRTKNAFDYGERSISAEFAMGYNDLVDDFSGDFPLDDYNPRFDFSISDFLNESQTLGYSFSANYSKDNYAVSEVTAGAYSTLDDLYYPRYVRLQEIFEDVESYGISAALEWRPDETTQLGAKYSFSRTDTIFRRQRMAFENGGFFVDPTNNDGENYTDYLYDGYVDKSLAYYEDLQDLHVFTLNGEKEVGDWTLTGDFGFNYSLYEEDPEDSLRGTLTQASDVVDFFYDARGDAYTPSVTNPGFDTEDISNYDSLWSADQRTYKITDTEYSFSADAARDVELAGNTMNFKFGGKVRLRERDQDRKRRSFGFTEFSDDPLDANYVAPEDLEGLIADYGIKSRVDGEYPGGFYLDPQDFLSFLNQLEEDGIITQRELFDLEAEAEESFEAEENVYATYAQAEAQFGKLTVLAGARIEFTDVEFRGSRIDFVDGITPLKDGNDYVDILPGLHLRYDATDDFIVRASVNKTLARPSYRQLNPTSLVDPDQLPDGGDIITRGNIDLDPTESWNFDLGFDYYYSESGYASLGVFAKLMENNIYPATRMIGVDEVSDYLNADSAEVYGVEFLIDQGFSFLPSYLSNLGASLNVTLVDSEVDTGLPGRDDDTPLFGQVETALNAAIYYRGDKFRARLSYNWTDDYLLVGGIDAGDENLDEYADAYGTLDFTMGYFITDNVELFFEAENITDEANRGYYGDDSRLSFNSYKGTTYFIGASWNL